MELPAAATRSACAGDGAGRCSPRRLRSMRGELALRGNGAASNAFPLEDRAWRHKVWIESRHVVFCVGGAGRGGVGPGADLLPTYIHPSTPPPTALPSAVPVPLSGILVMLLPAGPTIARRLERRCRHSGTLAASRRTVGCRRHHHAHTVHRPILCIILWSHKPVAGALARHVSHPGRVGHGHPPLDRGRRRGEGDS